LLEYRKQPVNTGIGYISMGTFTGNIRKQNICVRLTLLIPLKELGYDPQKRFVGSSPPSKTHGC